MRSHWHRGDFLLAAATLLAVALGLFALYALRTPAAEAPGQLLKEMLLAGGIVCISAFSAALLAHRATLWRLMRPVREMTAASRRVAEGDSYPKMTPPDTVELADLANAINNMARLLDERIRTAVAERNEREAILSSMVEGVIAVDSNQRIISMNRAAAELFDANPARVQGKSIQHAVRNPRVAELIADTLAEQGAISREMKVYTSGREVALQAHAAGLRDAAGKAIGVVVVLDDVTDLRRLERMRSDFVANVSHELKTPITSIKGFVETLLDGGMDSTDDARRFLEIVAKQADRLNAIIEDLLTLSRVEQDERAHESLLAPGALLPAVNGAVQLCASAAQAKEVRLVHACPPGLRARINAPLLEQGVTNLIDNAIKYSEQGGEVRVEVSEAQGEIVLAVIDQGCGISAEHLPRLFERFYRVDKARSRQLGGTGLGLAIVKHIAQTHGGRVVVDSKPGQGSTFKILLPYMDPAKGHMELAM